MINKIRALERISRELEPTPKQRKKTRDRVLKYTENFLNNIEKSKAFQLTNEKEQDFFRTRIAEKGISSKELLRLIERYVDYPGLNPASGGHLAYIPGGGIYYAALGDYLAAVTNRYAGILFAGPGAVRMENQLIRWMSKILGYPRSAAGNLASGGSIANLIGIVAARDSKQVLSRRVERSVIYLSDQAHHSIEKAIRIAGLEQAIIRRVPLDQQYRMIPVALSSQIETDLRDGLYPFLMIASAGTTDVGAIDPLAEIGMIARQYDLWYHVDAAYGGFFVLTPEGKRKLRGIEMSDSIVIDPHKGLFLPYGLGAVLVKNAADLLQSHRYFANYMQDARNADEELSPAELSPELTKHFRGMRLWLPLQLHGLRPFRACLQEKLYLAKYFYREIGKLGFETGPEPELSVVTYRYLPERGNANDFNRRLLAMVLEDGRVFISSTMLNGNYTLRFACLSFRTHLSTVDLLLQILKEKVATLTHARQAKRAGKKN